MKYEYDGMRVTIDCKKSYDGPYYRWKVVTDSDQGFYLSGESPSYRYACHQAKKAMKRLAGIGFLPYQGKDK